MTTAAICATSEVRINPSYYRGEQYDSDLGLYYLRARYYNPATGRFMSRDPLDGSAKDPASLHKYLYADGDPVNGWDPTGRAAAFGYVVRVAKFLLKVPTLTEFSIELTACLVAVAAAIEDVATHGDVGPVGLGAVLFPCFPLETHSVAYVVFLVTGFAL